VRGIVAVGVLVAGGCGRLDFDPESPCWPGRIVGMPFANSNEGATGSAGDPFLICTADQLDQIGLHPENWASSFLLARDLDLTARDAPITMIGSTAMPFAGELDGGGHAIIGLAYDMPNATGNVGLITTGGPNMYVHDLVLHDVNVVGDKYVGGLIGYARGPILERITLDGTVSGTSLVGGVIGGVECYMPDCGVANAVITMTDVTATVDVNAPGGDGGGIIGHEYSDGPVPEAVLTRLVSAGTVTGGGSLGGLVGDGEAFAMMQSSSSSSVIATISSGGLLGDTVFSRTIIMDSFATGDVTCSGAECGGLGGSLEGTVVHSYATGRVSCQGECAGLIGDTDGPILRSWATGNVDGGASSGDGVGGLVGSSSSFQSGAISDSYATGNVNGHNYVGGLVGTIAHGGNLVRSYATGTVTGSDEVGGLVGGTRFRVVDAVHARRLVRDRLGVGRVTDRPGLAARRYDPQLVDRDQQLRHDGRELHEHLGHVQRSRHHGACRIDILFADEWPAGCMGLRQHVAGRAERSSHAALTALRRPRASATKSASATTGYDARASCTAIAFAGCSNGSCVR
jgi:hypothetical protein